MKEREGEAETDRQALRPTTYSPGHHQSAAKIENSCPSAQEGRAARHSAQPGMCLLLGVLLKINAACGTARLSMVLNPHSLPGESGFPTKVSGSTGVAKYKEKNEHV